MIGCLREKTRINGYSETLEEVCTSVEHSSKDDGVDEIPVSEGSSSREADTDDRFEQEEPTRIEEAVRRSDREGHARSTRSASSEYQRVTDEGELEDGGDAWRASSSRLYG